MTNSDFWNNDRTVHARPQRMYDCGDDDSVWDISSSDILRGPANSHYWSDEVEILGGASDARLTVLMAGNWWGSDSREKVGSRMADFELDYGEGGSSPVVDPLAKSARTLWEPQGQVPDPQKSFIIITDPAYYLNIREPALGACSERSGVRWLKGSASPALGPELEEIFMPSGLYAAYISIYDDSQATLRSEHRFRLLSNECEPCG